ncbi:LAG1-DNAbind-domain-containing protein [Salix suchowensis]|nr:LAG1-DNAbind-domain-containing protein [Salix suchowensis]
MKSNSADTATPAAQGAYGEPCNEPIGQVGCKFGADRFQIPRQNRFADEAHRRENLFEANTFVPKSARNRPSEPNLHLGLEIRGCVHNALGQWMAQAAWLPPISTSANPERRSELVVNSAPSSSVASRWIWPISSTLQRQPRQKALHGLCNRDLSFLPAPLYQPELDPNFNMHTEHRPPSSHHNMQQLDGLDTDHTNYDIFNTNSASTFASHRYRTNASSSSSLGPPSYGLNGDNLYSHPPFGDSVPPFNGSGNNPYEVMNGMSSAYSSGKVSPLTPSDPVGGLQHSSPFPPGKDFSNPHQYPDLISDRRLSGVSNGSYPSDFDGDYSMGAVGTALPSRRHLFITSLTGTVPSHLSPSHNDDILRGVAPQATNSFREGGVNGFPDIPHYLGSNPHPELPLRMPAVDETLARMRIHGHSVMGASNDLQTFIRFLCPPPTAIMIGNSWWTDVVRRGEDPKLCPPRVTVSISGEPVPQEGSVEWTGSSGKSFDVSDPPTGTTYIGRCVGKQLFISDVDEKKKKVEALDQGRPSKAQTGHPYGLGSAISLYNPSFIARTASWDPFVMYIVDVNKPAGGIDAPPPPPQPDYPSPPPNAIPFTNNGSQIPIYYNQTVVLQCLTSGVVSPVLIIRKVDHQTTVVGGGLQEGAKGVADHYCALGEVCGDPVSQLHKIAFEVYDATKGMPEPGTPGQTGTFLSCMGEKVNTYRPIEGRQWNTQNGSNSPTLPSSPIASTPVSSTGSEYFGHGSVDSAPASPTSATADFLSNDGGRVKKKRSTSSAGGIAKTMPKGRRRPSSAGSATSGRRGSGSDSGASSGSLWQVDIGETSVWTIVGTDQIRYNFYVPPVLFDNQHAPQTGSFPIPSKPVTPFPGVVKYLPPDRASEAPKSTCASSRAVLSKPNPHASKMLTLYGENFSKTDPVSVFFGSEPSPYVEVRCTEVLGCLPPENQLVKRRPIVLARSDGIVFPSNVMYP